MKLCKIPVHVFQLVSVLPCLRKNRGTKYCLKLLPLGGYVSLEGENDKDSEDGFLNQNGIKD